MSLGLSSEEFWSLTPRQLCLLAQWRRREVERQEFGPAMIVTAIMATVRVHRSPYDFMPSQAGKKKPQQQTWEEKMQIIKTMHAGVGGTDGNRQGR